MNRPQAQLSLVILVGIGLVLLCLSAVAWARPTNGSVRYVAPPPSGSDGGNNCLSAGSPCATIQHAINQANPADEIYVAGGTYAPGGTVAAINKPLLIHGAFAPDFGGLDPDLYQTVLNGGANGSVISITNTGPVILEHLTLTNGNGSASCGAGTGCGGGIYADNADLHIGHLYIHHNVASTSNRGWGGGIYANDTSVEIWGSRINSNTGTSTQATTGNGSGGGLYINASTLVLRESEILDNVANARTAGDGYGGGLYLSNLNSCDVLSNTIRGNSGSPNGLNGYGSGIYMSSSTSVYVAANLIRGNSSPSGLGGGISSNWDDIHLDRNLIISNSVDTGGGIYIRAETPVTISNNLIAHNSSVHCCGGIYTSVGISPNGPMSLVNNTIVYNGNHGISTWATTTLHLVNNLIAFHDVGIWLRHPTSTTVTADHNLLWNTSDPVVGTNAVQSDPQLSVRYGLQEGSPALDAGIDVSWVTIDLEGNPRPSGAYDIGAFEGPRWDTFLPLTLRNQ